MGKQRGRLTGSRLVDQRERQNVPAVYPAGMSREGCLMNMHWLRTLLKQFRVGFLVHFSALTDQDVGAILSG